MRVAILACGERTAIVDVHLDDAVQKLRLKLSPIETGDMAGRTMLHLTWPGRTGHDAAPVRAPGPQSVEYLAHAVMDINTGLFVPGYQETP